MVKYKNLSLSSQHLKYKLNIAFYLMSILPLFVCIYFVSNYILPQVGLKLDITISILISIAIALIGFYVIREVVERILSVVTEAKLIAAGDINRRIDNGQEDEIGDLGKALNQLTQRIRTNMEELKAYSEKCKTINFEINKHVLILSNLLQIGSLISHGDKLENILKLAMEKSRFLANSDVAYLFIREKNTDVFFSRAADGINSGHFLQLKIDHSDKIFNRLIETNQSLILDKEHLLTEVMKTVFYEKFKMNNTLALPIYLKGKVMGILGIGNAEEILYKQEDIELLDLFSKQIAIAIENDLLMQRVEKLEIKDTLTGLYNGVFIRNRLEEEIKRAIIYRRPCAYLVFDVDNFQKFYQNFGLLQAETILRKIASLIKDSFTEVDRVARVGDNEFAIVLPERNKRQAKEIAEEIRKKIDFAFSKEGDVNRRLTVSGGVSENPLDGVNAEELITKAKELLNLAKRQGKNRIATFLQENRLRR